MSRDVAQSLGRIVLITFLLVALLAVLTTARFASTRARHRAPLTAPHELKPVKGDVRRTPDGTLQYFDGRQWSNMPLPPNDHAF